MKLSALFGVLPVLVCLHVRGVRIGVSPDRGNHKKVERSRTNDEAGGMCVNT